MQIFTIESGKIVKGAKVEKYRLNKNLSLPTIQIGESGRGRKLEIVPVSLKEKEKKRELDHQGYTWIERCELGKTQKGSIKIIENDDFKYEDSFLAVFRTKIGFRGWNEHTGDRCEEIYEIDKMNLSYYIEKHGIDLDEEKRYYSRDEAEKLISVIEESTKIAVNFDQMFYLDDIKFEKFPGRILVEGNIAQGAAGRMGRGSHLIATVPKGVVFRTGYGGRLYGSPRAHYYFHDGEELLSLSWKERKMSELF